MGVGKFFGTNLGDLGSRSLSYRRGTQFTLSSRTFYLPYLRNGWSNWCETKRKWVNWMLRWLGYLWPSSLTFTFDLEFSRSNCISGMGGPIVIEWKGQESIGCPDVKHNHYVTPRRRILLPTGWLKMLAFPSTRPRDTHWDLLTQIAVCDEAIYGECGQWFNASK